MPLRKLRVYTGPDAETTAPQTVHDAPAAVVRTTLGEILPLLCDAVTSNRTWLTDFETDEIAVSADLFDVLQAYRHFRRPTG